MINCNCSSIPYSYIAKRFKSNTPGPSPKKRKEITNQFHDLLWLGAEQGSDFPSSQRCPWPRCLPQLPGDLLLLSQLSRELPSQLGEHVQGSPVPAPKGVHSQGDERDALCCATLIILGHLDVERGLHPMLPIKSLSVNETT